MMTMPTTYYEQIPAELRSLPQWVVAREDAVPLQARNGRNADKRCAHHWCTFEQASSAGYPHVGFCLTESDPYTIIDLDDKLTSPATPEVKAFHRQLIASFGSYAEVSRSGRGYHIIVRGRIAKGRRNQQHHVEVYSSSAYVIITGNRVPEAPESVVDGQAGIDWLVANVLDQAIDPASEYTIGQNDEVEARTDEELLDILLGAENGAKARALWTGDWQALGYSSQSQADMALMDMLVYYTTNDEQCRRMFRYSGLGKREKAMRDDYLNGMIQKKRSEYISIASLTPAPLAPQTSPAPTTAPVVTSVEPVKPAPLQGSQTAIAWAPGAIGWLQHYIYCSSERPVADISLVATLGILAGMLGRYYNVGGTGLNQYLLLLGQTGTGKDELSRAPERLFSQVRDVVPSIDLFRGPGSFASGQAMVKRLAKQPCFFSVQGEWGHTFKEMESPHAIGALGVLKKVMLAVYGSSGQHQILPSTAYSDSEKDTASVSSPALTLMCETAPDVLLSSLSLDHVASGLLPRFLVFDYQGPRPPSNIHSGSPMSADMRQWFIDLATIALTQQQRQQALQVGFGDEYASDLLQKRGSFDRFCDDRINDSSDADPARHLWNRAHLKAMRLAALCAAASSPHNPLITREYAEWAIDTVQKDVNAMVGRFETGDIGSGTSKQLSDIRKALWAYYEMHNTPTGVERLIYSYRCPQKLVEAGLVPYSFLQRRTAPLPSFSKSPMGSGNALEAALKQLMASGEIIELDKQRCADYKYSGRAFSVNFG